MYVIVNILLCHDVSCVSLYTSGPQVYLLLHGAGHESQPANAVQSRTRHFPTANSTGRHDATSLRKFNVGLSPKKRDGY